MKLALIHDHLAQDGGAEKVLRVLHEVYPDAPTYTLVHNKKTANPAFNSKDIRTSFLQKMPWGVRKYQWYFPFMPMAVEGYDLRDFDVVLSSSSAFAKGVITRPNTLHICYCHTPTRYLWSDTHDYVRELKYNALVRKFVPFLLTDMRVWDRQSADRVDIFVANSRNVQNRIWKYYRRPSIVIPPPVDTSRFKINPTGPDKYFLTGGRLVYYKRFDITIQAFNRLNIPLKVFGIGPELENLRKMARPNIEFVGQVSDEKQVELYRNAQAFIHPQEEDFGITAVESMASGRPVIAYKRGGALETIIDGVTGKFFDEQTWEELADAVIRFRLEKYDPAKIKEHSATFDTQAFKRRLNDFISESYKNFKTNNCQANPSQN